MRRISADEQEMRAVPLCGKRVIERLKSIGITKLTDLKGKNPQVLMQQVNLAAGKVIWRPPMAILALSNLIKAAHGELHRQSVSRRMTKAIETTDAMNVRPSKAAGRSE